MHKDIYVFISHIWLTQNFLAKEKKNNIEEVNESIVCHKCMCVNKPTTEEHVTLQYTDGVSEIYICCNFELGTSIFYFSVDGEGEKKRV